ARRGKRKPEQDSNPHAHAPGTPGISPVTPPVTPRASGADDFSDRQLRDLYRALLLPRLIEEKMLRLLRQGKLSKWLSGIGQEAIAVGVASALEFKTFRMRGHEEASGVDYVPAELIEECAARDPLARFERLLDARPIFASGERDDLRRSPKDD